MKKKKVILPVINDLTIDQRMHKICTSLTEMGFEVLLVGAKRKKSLELAKRDYQTARVPLIFEKGKIFYLEFNLRIFFFLLFRKADIITSNDLDTLLPSFLVSKLKGSVLIYDSHEYFTEMPELDHRPFTKKIWLTLERFLFPKLERITTVNQSIADIYEALYQRPIKVLRNVPFRLKELPVLEKKNVVIYQGNINKSRGIEVMLEALKQLENVEFWCVGPGDLLDEMKNLAKSLNVEHKVKFWGAIPFQQLSQITAQAKIGISIEQPIGLNSTLCLPNKLMDYIQCHLPVIVSDLPEMRKVIEQFQNGVILKDSKSASELAQTISNMLNNEELMNKYSKNAATAAEHLCWENEVKVLKEIYEPFL
ncbi:MAG: glycosyltransferase family 4 protein [Cytophagales bacterium]